MDPALLAGFSNLLTRLGERRIVLLMNTKSAHQGYRVTTTMRAGWAATTIQSPNGDTMGTLKLRNTEDVLVKVSDFMKKEYGVEGISWGACGSKYWVGFSF